MSEDQEEPSDLDDEEVVRQAKAIIAQRLARGIQIQDVGDAKDLVVLELTNLAREEFGCLFLDSRNCVITFELLFSGSINRANVHPRVIAKQALDLHAAAVIICHNHPSGDPHPSQSDISLTKQLVDVLNVLDIKVLDHLIVGGAETYSLVEHGLM